MSTQTGRTFVGSVVCIDLVGYSMRSVEQQESIKRRFNRLLTKALHGSPEKGRTILDTGDGALITFLGDPEHCFSVALRTRDVMNADALPVRLGIHLGSVKLSVGMSGNPSIVGDGVNVAERIATFAEPGQIVVSRAFHDVVSRLSDAHARLFAAAGVRTDKNGREHEVFAVAPQPGPSSAAARGAGGATVSFKPRTLAIVAGGVLAVAALGVLAYRLLRPEPKLPEVALKTEAPPPPRVEPPKPEPARVESPPPEPRRSPPRSEPRAPPPETRPARPASEGERVLSALTGGAREAARTVGSTAQNVLSTVTSKARELGSSGGGSGSATPVSRSTPAFPQAAAAQGIRSGTVRARLDIDAAGYVTHVDVIHSDPPRVFDQEAIRALQRWRFNTGADGRTYETDLQFRR